jgi:aryl-alcohol dehydrogenase-like predicted oxidoreductase
MTIAPRPLAGHSVLPVGLGCMGFAWAYERTSDDDPVAVIRAALDAGAAHLDTSDVYGPFESERIVGRAIDGRRADTFLATKAGLVAKDLGSMRRDGSPEHLRSACDASLQRLGVDRIDLWYLHRADEDVPVEESWGAMADLVAAGKAAALGISEVTVDELDRVHAIHPVAAVQSELSIWTRDRLDDVLPWCAANGAGFVAFSPLGRGFLAGALASGKPISADDFRARLPRFTADALAANAAIVDGVLEVAARRGVTAAQVALAWVLARGEQVHVIPGTTRAAHLQANLSAGEVELTAEDLSALDALPAPVGARY